MRLLDRIKAQNAELDQLCDELIERKAPGYKHLAIIRERDRLREALNQISHCIKADTAHEIARAALHPSEEKP